VSSASRYAPPRRPGGRLAVLPRRPILRAVAASRGPVVGDCRLPARSGPRSDARAGARPYRVRAFGPRRQRRDLRRDPAARDSAMTVQARTEPSMFVKVQPEGSTGARVDLSAKVLSLVYEDCEGKADKLVLTVDNWDLANFDDPVWRKGNLLEVSWGY